MIDGLLTPRQLATALLAAKLPFGDPDSMTKVSHFSVRDLLTPNFLPSMVAGESENNDLSLTSLGDALQKLSRIGRADLTMFADAERILPIIIEDIRRVEDEAKQGINPDSASAAAFTDRFVREVLMPMWPPGTGKPMPDLRKIMSKPVTPNEINAMQEEALRTKNTLQLCRQALETIDKGICRINQSLKREREEQGNQRA